MGKFYNFWNECQYISGELYNKKTPVSVSGAFFCGLLLFCFPSKDHFFQQNRKDPDNQEQIESEKTPDQQSQPDRSFLENALKIKQEAAFLCAAGARQRGIARADEEQAAERQQLIPRCSGHPEGVIHEDNRGKQSQHACRGAGKLKQNLPGGMHQVQERRMESIKYSRDPGDGDFLVADQVNFLQPVNQELRKLLDIKIYVEADADERILRRVIRDVKERGRDVEGIAKQYLTTVKPMHYIYVEPTKYMADIVLNSGLNDVVFDVMKVRIQAHLNSKKDS